MRGSRSGLGLIIVVEVIKCLESQDRLASQDAFD